jgi:hypothetical protein
VTLTFIPASFLPRRRMVTPMEAEEGAPPVLMH